MISKYEKKISELKEKVKSLKKKNDKIKEKLKDEKEQRKALERKLAKALKKKQNKEKQSKAEKKANKKAEKLAKKEEKLLKKANKTSSNEEEIKEINLETGNASKGDELLEKYIEKELVCINCPIGCLVSVKGDPNDVDSLEISGNKCCRGRKYVKSEVLNPTRMVTSSIKVLNGDKELVSVKTEKPIPKDLIFKVMDEIRGASVHSPVEIGDVLIKDVAGTGISVVATSHVKKKKY